MVEWARVDTSHCFVLRHEHAPGNSDGLNIGVRGGAGIWARSVSVMAGAVDNRVFGTLADLARLDIARLAHIQTRIGW